MLTAHGERFLNDSRIALSFRLFQILNFNMTFPFMSRIVLQRIRRLDSRPIPPIACHTLNRPYDEQRGEYLSNRRDDIEASIAHC